MSSNHILLLLALLVPLTLDTFIVSTALGLAGLPKQHHLRTSLTLAAFEAVMPAVGVLIGHFLADFIGNYADYFAGAIIALAGMILFWPADQKKSIDKQNKLISQTKGLAIISLGLSISIDELALGLSLGLLHVPLLLAAVLIGCQAFIASQLGLRLGQKLSEKFRAYAERAAGALLIVIGLIIVGLKFTGHGIK